MNKQHAWRVERSLSLNGGGYGTGWLAMQNGTGIGAWFRTWNEAMQFALTEAQRYSLAVGTIRREASNVTQLDQPKTLTRKMRADLWRDVPEMLAIGMSHTEVADALGVTPARVYQKFPARQFRRQSA